MIDIEESAHSDRILPIVFFPEFADYRHLYNVRPFHENQNSLRAEPDRLSACRWCTYRSLLWLFARHNNGEFVLRIEDTDLERSTPEAIEAIMDGMNWLNLAWDEGPYFQTKRFDRYNAVIDEMLVAGTAYKCYCSGERLDALREGQMAKGEKPRYDGRCRHDHSEHAADEPCVVRFANPQDGSVIFDDQIRGPIEFSNQSWMTSSFVVLTDRQPITSA